MLGLLLLVLGCQNEDSAGSAGVADYQLALHPVRALNQTDAFEDIDDLQLRLRFPDGKERIVGMGDPKSGITLSIDGQPALDGVQLVVEGRANGEIKLWGQAGPLTAETGSQDVSIFVARTDTLGWLADLPRGAAFSEAVALGDGQFLITGGAEIGRGGGYNYTSELYQLSLLPPNGALIAEALPSTLPPLPDGTASRLGFALTQIGGTGPDAGKILLIGGSKFDILSDCEGTTDEVSLLDLSTQTWETLPANKSLSTNRGRFAWAADTDGAVLVWGGASNDGSSSSCSPVIVSSFEIYDPLARQVNDPTTVDGEVPGELAAAATSLEDGSFLVCGGMKFDDLDGVRTTAEWAATPSCVRVSTGGDITPVGDWCGGRVAGLAMARLADGSVLGVGGGVPDAESNSCVCADTSSACVCNGFVDDDLPATDAACLFSPTTNTWSSLPSLARPRAGAKVVPLPDGRALIAGGGDLFSLYSTSLVTDQVACVEVFDPGDPSTAADDAFFPLDSCVGVGSSGALKAPASWMTAAVDPSFGALLLGGVYAHSNGSGTLQSTASVEFFPTGQLIE